MKTTLDIPDTIYRQFKTRVAMNGETMRKAIESLKFIANVRGFVVSDILGGEEELNAL